MVKIPLQLIRGLSILLVCGPLLACQGGLNSISNGKTADSLENEQFCASMEQPPKLRAFLEENGEVTNYRVSIVYLPHTPETDFRSELPESRVGGGIASLPPRLVGASVVDSSEALVLLSEICESLEGKVTISESHDPEENSRSVSFKSTEPETGEIFLYFEPTDVNLEKTTTVDSLVNKVEFEVP